MTFNQPLPDKYLHIKQDSLDLYRLHLRLISWYVAIEDIALLWVLW